MTDRTDHHLAAQQALADVREWGQRAEEPTPRTVSPTRLTRTTTGIDWTAMDCG